MAKEEELQQGATSRLGNYIMGSFGGNSWDEAPGSVATAGKDCYIQLSRKFLNYDIKGIACHSL